MSEEMERMREKALIDFDKNKDDRLDLQVVTSLNSLVGI
jgi:hypothetical protein